MQFLPSTCLIQKKLLLFVSGYRNYAGKTLLKESTLGNFKQPGGSVVLSCFPKLVDNIDILEILIAVWSEDVIAPMSLAQKKNFTQLNFKVKEIIMKIYPVLFADEFDMTEKNVLESKCFDKLRHDARCEMLISALRFGQPAKAGRPAPKKPIEDMTTFRPFNVRETQWEVWDVKESKYEQYLNLHQQRGMFDNTFDIAPGRAAPQPGGAPMSQFGQMASRAQAARGPATGSLAPHAANAPLGNSARGARAGSTSIQGAAAASTGALRNPSSNIQLNRGR